MYLYTIRRANINFKFYFFRNILIADLYVDFEFLADSPANVCVEFPTDLLAEVYARLPTNLHINPQKI